MQVSPVLLHAYFYTTRHLFYTFLIFIQNNDTFRGKSFRMATILETPEYILKLNSTALIKAKIVHNLGLYECSRAKLYLRQCNIVSGRKAQAADPDQIP